jgi:uncharacterized membrane protein
MLWLLLLLLHIAAVICWCGSLLYLPALITGVFSDHEEQSHQALTFQIFTGVATPAALTAIVSGTALFLTGGIIDRWLILKLTLVLTLVLCHALSGWILIRAEHAPDKNLTLPCIAIGIMAAISIPAIVWIVLTKPF